MSLSIGLSKPHAFESLRQKTNRPPNGLLQSGTYQRGMVTETQPPTDVLITVDTEVSTPLYDYWESRKLDREVRRDIYGETTRGEFGLLYQLRMLRQYGFAPHTLSILFSQP